MAWERVSNALGLDGIEPVEAAVGALFVRDFQKMDDPLIRVST